MASLAPKPYPGHWNMRNEEYPYNNTCDCANFMECMRKENEDFEAIPEDKIWATGIADGAAYYFIKSEKPLVLQHIPFGDRWQAPYAMIRGLRLADIKREQERTRAINELFAGKKLKI